MAQFKAMDSKVEVNGETILAVVSGMTTKEMARRILSECGIADPQPGRWYKQQAWLDAFQKIAANIGPNSLFRIGQAVPESAKWPPDVNSLEKALASIDVAYHLNHRYGEIGHYRLEKTGDPKRLRVICENPYPCPFDRGLVDAVANKFKPREAVSMSVTHDEKGSCRASGAASCVYEVVWR